MPQPEHTIILEGDPDDVQQMLAVASQVEPRIFRKHWMERGKVALWYRAENPRPELLDDIKQRAGLLAPPETPDDEIEDDGDAVQWTE